MKRAWPVLVVLLGCAGCVGSALESETEVRLLRLQVPELPRGGETLAATVAVARPRSAVSLDTDYVAVELPGSRFDHLAGLRWSEPAPALLQQLVVTALEQDGRFVATVASPSRVPADYLLDLELRGFQAEYAREGAAPVVRVRVQGSLVEPRASRRVTTFVAEAAVPAAENRQAAVVAAFERATREVLARIAAEVRQATPTAPAG